MNLAETIYQKSLDLPEEKAIEVIDFIDFIKSRAHLRASAVPAQKQGAISPLYQAFEQAGLIGCIETDEQLATTYKQKLDFSFKHDVLK